MRFVSRLAPVTMLIAAAFVALTVRAEAANPEDVIVVANRSVKTDKITIEDLRAMFLKQRGSWPSGERCVPINVKGSDLREAFRKRVLQMTESEEQRYWQDQKIVRAKTEPTEFKTPQRAVFSIKGALSYVFRKDLKEKAVKVVLVIPKK